MTFPGKTSFLIETGALDQIQDAIIAIDNDFKIIYLNKAAEDQYNLDRQGSVGSDFRTLLKWMWLTPEDEHNARESLEKNGYWKGENVNVTSHGKKMLIESIISVLKDKSDNNCGLIAILRDITGRKELEKWLIESEQRFKLAVDAAKMLVYEIDPDSGKMMIIQGLQKLLGYASKEISQTSEWWNSQVHIEDAKKYSQFRKILSVPKDNSIHYRMQHKDGIYIIVEDFSRTLMDNNKKVRVVGAVRDVTRRVTAERELELYTKHLEEVLDERTKALKDAERLSAIGQTAAMVGHDIRNPLQSIVSSIFLVNAELNALPDSKEKTDAQEELAAITEQISYIDKIISDLQDYTKPLMPSIVEVELGKQIHTILSELTIPSDIQVEMKTDELIVLNLDPMFFKRIIVNLVTNAIQAMPDGGVLTLQSFIKGNEALVIVKDTGHGIPEEIQDKIFSPLFTTKSKGQGFGLAVVKRLVEALGGIVTFESQAGAGTKFTVSIPLKTNNEKSRLKS